MLFSTCVTLCGSTDLLAVFLLRWFNPLFLWLSTCYGHPKKQRGSAEIVEITGDRGPGEEKRLRHLQGRMAYANIRERKWTTKEMAFARQWLSNGWCWCCCWWCWFCPTVSSYDEKKRKAKSPVHMPRDGREELTGPVERWPALPTPRDECR